MSDGGEEYEQVQWDRHAMLVRLAADKAASDRQDHWRYAGVAACIVLTAASLLIGSTNEAAGWSTLAAGGVCLVAGIVAGRIAYENRKPY